ncbi:MAG: hypothetical protein BMS9Abin31_0301 [Gammaproteobacteria bacterium]|nr:MAG: hypothetical protein BMS9Abin31_0301 [Gammaproteobacteria bacterium]
MNKFRTICAGLILLIPLSSWSAGISRQQIKGLDEQVQEIKKDVLAISAELQLLEEKLLYPSTSQVSLFVSVAKDGNYSPDAMQIKIDGKKVAHHIYSFKEVDALRRGGVQRIYTGNIRGGEHRLDISVIGKNNGSKTTQKTTYTLKKGVGPKLVEIRLGSAIKIKDR